MPSSKTARVFLSLNAAFSFIIGIDLTLASHSAAQLLFAEQSGWQSFALLFLGVGLLIFALDLIISATNRFVTKREVMINTLLDMGWVAGSVFLLAFYGHIFTENGKLIIEIVAIIVAVLAIGQIFGAARIVSPVSQADISALGGTLIARVKRKVDAPATTVWDVMTDHPGYADVASNIAKVEVLSGEGLGMQRRCYGLKGENWRETCDLFEAGKAFGFKIHTEAKDYPYPISDLQGRWSVQPNGTHSEFSIDIRAKPKGSFLTQALFKMAARRQFKAVLIDLADAWADRMEKQARA